METSYVVAGATVGFIVGLTGVGGGALMTPLLVLVFGFSPAVAVGTDLLFAGLTKSVGVMVHGSRKTVRWRVAALLGLGSLPGSMATVWALKRFEAAGGDFNAIITPVLGFMLILTSLVLFTKGRWQRWVLDDRFSVLRQRYRHWRSPVTIVVGLILGVFVTLSSIGAGALGAAFLFLLYPRMPAVQVVGTDLAHAVPLAFVAGLGHLHLGTVDFGLLGSLLLGSVPAIAVGSYLGGRLPEWVMRPILACMLLVMGLRFAF